MTLIVATAATWLVQRESATTDPQLDTEQGETSSQSAIGDPGSNEPQDGGPLATHAATGYFVNTPSGSGAGSQTDSDQSTTDFTDAYDVLRIEGDAPITVLAVESVGTDSQGGEMRLLDARLAGPERTGNFQFFPRHEPLPQALGDLVEAEGATIGATARQREIGYALVLTYQATGVEPMARSGIRITYEAHGTIYRRSLPLRIIFCGDLSVADCDNYKTDLFPQC